VADVETNGVPLTSFELGEPPTSRLRSREKGNGAASVDIPAGPYDRRRTCVDTDLSMIRELGKPFAASE